MSITSALVLFTVIWFLVLFVALPIGLRTQGDENRIVPGTHAGSPANLDLRRKAIWVTVIALVVWAAIAGVIVSGVVSVRDLDWFGRMEPAGGTDG